MYANEWHENDSSTHLSRLLCNGVKEMELLVSKGIPMLNKDGNSYRSVFCSGEGKVGNRCAACQFTFWGVSHSYKLKLP